jgi:lipoprotein-releasing system ATP-binding protein
MVNSENNNKVSVSDRLMSVRGLSKSFDHSGARIDVLKDINLDLDAGETLAIVGASGIGKSTLLHILGALDRPDSGTFLFQGDDVFLFDHARLAQFRNGYVGFVFQFHHLEILVRVGLKDRLYFSVGKLSGGEHQRVALARALVLKPVILLADEPTGNLDRKNSGHVHELFLELNQEYHVTLIVVTHNMELASHMSRSATIIDGQLLESG